MDSRIKALAEKGRLIRRQMWKSHQEGLPKREQALYAFLRVAAITWMGIKENRILNRSAALSFSSMLAFAPVIVLVVLVAGFAIDTAGVDNVVDKLDNLIEFIAPQLEDLEKINAEEQSENAAIASQALETPRVDGSEERLTQDKERMEDILREFIAVSQSGKVGIAGAMVLILIVIQLFSSIEGAFNDIWGVRRGRAWVTRVGMYWTVITLGAVLAFAGLTILATELATLSDNLLRNYAFLELWLAILVKATSFTMIICILAIFYRFIPNTQVTWRAGFIGAFFAVVCILLNNELAFLYLERVVLLKSLYGSLALIPVLMFGLFMFWFIILLGGRVTYAVQNARFKSDKIAWDELSQASREGLSLLMFATICRRFRDCKPAPTVEELAEESRLPVQLINSSLSMLGDLGLISSSPKEEKAAYQSFTFQPAKPLDRIGLLEFKERFENFGSEPDENLFDNHDPVVERFHALIQKARQASLGSLTFDSIIGTLDQEGKKASKDDAHQSPESKIA